MLLIRALEEASLEEKVAEDAANAADGVAKAATQPLNWNDLWTKVSEWVMGTGIKVLIAIIVLLVAFKLINFLVKKITKANDKSGKIDKTIAKTLLYVLGLVLKCVVVISLVAFLGIDTSAITALIASLGVCVGLAVNGALGNIAGGVLLLITRPFRVDDFIEVAGTTGTVEEIRLCHTKIVTLDNKVVYVPNGTASGSNVVNYSEKELRRVDLEFEISEEEDFEVAKKILNDIIDNHEKVLKDPGNTVRVVGSTDNGIVICCRAWCKNADYWDVFFDVREQAKKGFDEAKIEFPYEQMDVRVIDKRDREAR